MQQININNSSDGNSKFPSIDELKELILVKYKRVTIMALILVMLICITAGVFSKYSSSENVAYSKYTKYMNELYATNTTTSTKTTKKVILPAEGTVDIDKINSDIDTAETFLKKIFTFSNGEEYDSNRETLITMFGEDSTITKQVYINNEKTEVDGKEYNYVDLNGLNMKVTDIRTYPIDINNDGNNRYLSCVTFTTHQADGDNISSMVSVLYDVDEYGSIINCDIYLLRLSNG
jgi:hypothetical protein